MLLLSIDERIQKVQDVCSLDSLVEINSLIKKKKKQRRCRWLEISELPEVNLSPNGSKEKLCTNATRLAFPRRTK